MATGLVACWAVGSARAAVEVLTTSVTPSAAGYTDQINLPQFDSPMGTLQSVTVQLAGTGNFVQLFQNLGAVPAQVTISQNLGFGLQVRSAGSQLGRQILSLGENQISQYVAGAYRGGAFFQGSAGGTYTYPVTAAGQVILTSAQDLAAFTGQGLVDLYLSTDGTLTQVVSGNLGVADGNLVAGADLTVTYLYAVPEPTAWGTASLALMGLAWAARMRRRWIPAGG